MSSDPVFVAVLSDVTYIREWCTRNQGSPVPRGAIEYIAANADVLAFFLSALYDGTTESERAKLHASNPTTLDYSVTDPAFRALAESTIKESIQCAGGNPLTQVEEDDIAVLLRALQYVQHINGRHCPISLDLSPLYFP